MDTSVTPAVIAAIASLIGASVSLGIAIWNTRKAKDLEKLKTKLTRELDDHKNDLAKDLEAYRDVLTEKQAERAARREYQYEARKRLYQQYEPLLFQLVECCENARGRIYSLARTARQGHLGQTGWLSQSAQYRDNYYFCSTIYYLLSPLMIFKLMQKSVTFVDLSVDLYIKDQYLLAKQLAWSFTDAHDFAKIAPPIKYDPKPNSSNQQLEEHPEIYCKQGITVGELDKAVEACIKDDSNDSSRVSSFMSYGEFEEAYRNPETSPKFHEIRKIFLNFHPKTRPVL